MITEAPDRDEERVSFGLPSGDPLSARLFPSLPGSVKWGLERTERLLASLRNPHRRYPVLHVGGTNGKGSVARIWAEILRAAGLRTGLYTSPHLISYRERLLVNGRPLPDELLEEWARDLRPLLLREAPSFFEAGTALAFLAMARAEVDVAVVEVGLGGRLDATNVVDPVLTAVTNVGIEHQGFLGLDVGSIAREKAGIMKPGVPVFTSCDRPEVLAVLKDAAAERGAILQRVSAPAGRVTLDGLRLRLDTARWGPLELASGLSGLHQLGNIALAVRALEALPPRLPVSASAVREGVLRARVPGRFQVEYEAGRRWILDIAHNPDAVRAVVRSLDAMASPAPSVGLVGILGDKDWVAMLTELAPVLDRLILTIPTKAPPGRRWDPEAAARALSADRVRVVTDFDAAVQAAKEEAGASGTIVALGSTYTVGEALEHLGRVPREALPVSFEPA